MTHQQQQQLTQFYKTSQDHRERQRVRALLLSHRNYTIPDLADFAEVDRDTVSRWMNRWQECLVNTQQPLTLQDQTRADQQVW